MMQGRFSITRDMESGKCGLYSADGNKLLGNLSCRLRHRQHDEFGLGRKISVREEVNIRSIVGRGSATQLTCPPRSIRK